MATTMHLYAGDTDKVFTTYTFGGTPSGTPSNGSQVQMWVDEQTPTSRDICCYWYDATTNSPTYATPGAMALPSVAFNGSSQYLRLARYSTGGAYSLTNIFAAGGKYCIAAVQFRSAGTNLASDRNGAVISDGGGYWGMMFKTVSGSHYVYTYNYDGVTDATANIAVSLNTTYVVVVRHDGTNLRCEVISGAGGATSTSQSVASGNTTNIANPVAVGRNEYWGTHLDCLIGELYCDNTDLGSSPTIRSDFISRWLPGGGGGSVVPLAMHLARVRRAG